MNFKQAKSAVEISTIIILFCAWTKPNNRPDGYYENTSCQDPVYSNKELKDSAVLVVQLNYVVKLQGILQQTKPERSTNVHAMRKECFLKLQPKLPLLKYFHSAFVIARKDYFQLQSLW